MKKISDGVLITGIIVLGIVVLAIIGVFSSYDFQGKTVTSNGYSTIKVLPDTVSIYFNIQTYGKTSSEANEANSEILKKMSNILMTQGFSESEIQTQGFNIYPEYDYSNGKSTITRYVASHSIKVSLNAVDNGEKIGNAIDAGVNSGAGISYINFELSQESQNTYKAEAIKRATMDAKIKAQALADGSGSKLGDLVSISTSDFTYQPWIAYSSSDGSGITEAKAATSITPSEQEVSASVTAVFKIR